MVKNFKSAAEYTWKLKLRYTSTIFAYSQKTASWQPVVLQYVTDKFVLIGQIESQRVGNLFVFINETLFANLLGPW